MSTKMARLMRQRRKLSERLWEERGPWCQVRTVVCTGLHEGLHELVGRRQGGSLTDERNVLLCCNRCNTYVEDHPPEARARGWKCPRWDAVDGDDGLIPSDEWRVRHGRAS